MIDYNSFYYISSVLWFFAIIFLLLSFKKSNKFLSLGLVFNVLAILVISGFIVYLWQELDRPPMRTLGETRLWYALFLPIIGTVFYIRWKYVWILFYTILMAFLFLTLNYFNPDMYSQTLMPALQSPWFVPHVIVYLFSYAALGVSCIVAIKELIQPSERSLQMADNLVYIGTAFLTLGLLFGALWAKEAWGHYWTWDPKETWAFLTWIGYILYIHYRFYHPREDKKAMYLLASAFVILLICWFGVNYLPTAQNSVHTYTS
ncbi:MAG: cytochrome c biogenesis protein CcsA [Flavobacterium sp.]|jgi:ABC-type transport system involved in cytochrome c biogenesis permease subunit|nr:cytochrome c biogenesis protein CcsA [Flavobacterium sp.]